MNAPQKIALRHALATAWLAHLAALREHLPRVLDSDDDEHLHQFRVALRKTRALLTLFLPVVPDARLLKDEFKWLATTTGAMRDLDVLSAQAHRQLAATPEKRAAAAPILAELRHRRSAAQETMRELIDSPRTHSLLEQWQRFLAALPTRTDLPPRADIPAWTAIRVQILRNSRRLLKDGKDYDSTTPAQALHELRIRGKRLRYLLESFDLAAHEKRIASPHRKLRKLQTVLGAHQDGVVAAQYWQELAKTLGRRKGIGLATLGVLREWTAAAEASQLTARMRLSKSLEKFARACAES